jgi:hypothetical protein
MSSRPIRIVDLSIQADRLEQLIITSAKELVMYAEQGRGAIARQCQQSIKDYAVKLERKKEALRRNVAKLTDAERRTIGRYKDADVLRRDVSRLGVEPRW